MAKRLSNDWLPHTLWLKYIVAKALVAGRQTARGQGRRESGQGRGQRDARAEPRQRADSGLPCVSGLGLGRQEMGRVVAGATVTGMPEVR